MYINHHHFFFYFFFIFFYKKKQNQIQKTMSSSDTDSSYYEEEEDEIEEDEEEYNIKNNEDAADNDENEEDEDECNKDGVAPPFDDIFDMCFSMLEEYMEHDENMLKMMSPTVEQTITTDLTDAIAEIYPEWAAPMYEELFVFIRQHVVDYAFCLTDPRFVPRQISASSTTTTTTKKTALQLAILQRKVAALDALPHWTQRSPEWFTSRYNLISASMASKALASEAQRNSLIFEKCKPFEAFQEECRRHAFLGTNSPMHWGIKYEPITVRIYETVHQTILHHQYGCIAHPTYPWLGASPDGINADPHNERLLGRMVEIKNIVNREIEGEPFEQYWVQMQMQMEVCDLDECDFVETRIKEFASREDYLAFIGQSKVERKISKKLSSSSSSSTSTSTSTSSASCCDATQLCGIVARIKPKGFVKFNEETGQLESNPDAAPYYVYSAFGETDVDGWLETEKQKHFMNAAETTHTESTDPETIPTETTKTTTTDLSPSLVEMTVSYYYVDEYSCVLVQRNKAWFQAALPVLRSCWETILRERESGAEHRAPKRRKMATTSLVEETPTTPIIVVKKLDE